VIPKKILIVDDELAIRILIEQTLEELEDKGVDILTAVNGKEAMDTIQTEKPGLVFLDIQMPIMDGFEVCYKLKHELGLNDIYIVMLTAKGQDFDRQRGMEMGANVYMTKPFDPDELLELAENVLEL
jgi:DNA-binding response OmpR family regulator